MSTVLEYNVPRGDYEADACIVRCFDARWNRALGLFVSVRRFFLPDILSVAGGAKVFAEDGPEREEAFASVNISIEKHAARRVILFVDLDCAAFGGSEAFFGDDTEEIAHHSAVLQRAAQFLVERLPDDVEMECYILTFTGTIAVPNVALCATASS